MSGIAETIPAVWLLLGAGVLVVSPRRVRSAVAVAVPLLALVLLVRMEPGSTVSLTFAGLDLTPFQLGRTNTVFGIIFLLISSLASLYAWHIDDRGQQVASMLYAAGALGVTFAGNFFTLLVFWELMAAASAWLVFARRLPESVRAGFRYLMVHFAGGSVLMGGILLHFHETGSLALTVFAPGSGLAAWLILTGVCVNVALPPLHAWLADAYPKATVTGAIFMSALTTKSAVYVLLILFPGWQILVYGGVIMALYGVVYAVLANDIRQILAYHIISQVGYMVAGVGIGTELSMNGTVAHAYSHILYKALLFMGAGAVIQATGVSKLSDLGGLSQKMRPVVWLFMIGAFSISGFPLFNGFISKSMIVSSAGSAHYEGVMLGLMLASVGTFLHTGLKIPVFTFWGRDAGLKVRRIPANMYAAMGIVAFLCTLYGVAPGLLYGMLPHDKEYHPFTAYHLVESVQLLVFTFIGFWIFREKLAGERCIALDTDWFYRRGARAGEWLIVRPVNLAFEKAAEFRGAVVSAILPLFANPYHWLKLNAGPRNLFDPDRERPYLGVIMVYVLTAFVFLSLAAVLV